MEMTEKAFELVIQRWPNPRPDLFDGPYRYYVIATNDPERSPKDLFWFHIGRGNAENYIKELKSGFGMNLMPCQRLRANGVRLAIGILAHNLAVTVKRLLPGGEWVTK